MKRLFTAVLMGLMVASLALAQNADALITELRAVTGAPTRNATELRAAYDAVLDALLVPLSDETNEDQLMPREGGPILARQGAQVALRDIALRSTRTGAEVERLALSQAIAARLGQVPNVYAQAWLVRMLEFIGRAEAVPALTGLLGNADPLVSDPARRALAQNPSPEAAAALRTALDAAATPAAQLALVNALGHRADAGAVAAIAARLGAADDALAAGAARALGAIGGAEALAALGAARAGATGLRLSAIETAWLRAAESLGNDAAAQAAYNAAYASPTPRLKAAGLLGLARTTGNAALPLIDAALRGDDWDLATAALRALLLVPGAAANQILADALPALTPLIAAQALRTVGERGDVALQPAVLALLGNADEGITLAALRTLTKIGDGAIVGPVAALAGGAEGPVQNAARLTLAQAPNEAIDQAILAGLGAAQGTQREEMVRALAVRRSPAAVQALAQVIANDADEGARLTALEALTALASPDELPVLVGALTRATSDAERAAAEAAVAATVVRTDDTALRAQALLAALPNATGATRAAVLRALGLTGDAAALAALRADLGAADAVVATGAIEGLAAWPTAEPLADLQRLAEGGSVPALRGYLRLLNLSDLDMATRSQRFVAARPLATGVEEKRALVQALGAVATVEALQTLESVMDEEPAVVEDAARSVVTVGTALRGTNPDEVRGVATNARELARDRRLVGDLNVLIDSVSAGFDAVLDWLISPIYAEAGKDHIALHDQAFAPEQAGADVTWTPIAGDAANSGAVVFDGLPFHGDQRVIYAKAEIYAPAAMTVQAQTGSDDGIKVWVNGEVVHSFNNSRALTVNQDTFNISLNEGWNPVLIKVSQGGGNWSFNLRLRDTDGVKVEGLRSRAQ